MHCAVSGYQLANNVASYVHIIIIGQDSTSIMIVGYSYEYNHHEFP